MPSSTRKHWQKATTLGANGRKAIDEAPISEIVLGGQARPANKEGRVAYAASGAEPLAVESENVRACDILVNLQTGCRLIRAQCVPAPR